MEDIQSRLKRILEAQDAFSNLQPKSAVESAKSLTNIPEINFQTQGTPVGVDSRLIGDAYSPINQVSPLAEVSERRLANSFNQALPDASPLNLEKYPSKLDVGDLLERYPSNSHMSFNDQLDIPSASREIPMQRPSDKIGNMFTKYGQKPVDVSNFNLVQSKAQTVIPDALQAVKDDALKYGKAFTDVGSGTDQADDLARALARKELWDSAKSGALNMAKSGAKSLGKAVTSPAALAGLAAAPLEMAAESTGNSALGALDAGASEGSIDDYIESGKTQPNKAKPDAPAFDENKAAPFAKSTDMQSFFGGGENQPQPARSIAEANKEEKSAQPAQVKAITAQIQKSVKNPEKAIEQANVDVAKAEEVLNKPDATDTEMEDAIKQRNMSLFMGRLMQAANSFGAALGGANAQTLKANQEGAQTVIDNAGQVVKDVTNKRESMKQKMELQREQEKNDPNSPVSQLYREGLLKVAPELGEKIKGMSAYDVEKAFPVVTSAFNAVESRETRLQTARMFNENRQLAREQMLQEKQDKHDQIMLKGYQQAAQTHPRMKDAMTALDEAGTVQDVALKALKEGGQSVSALGTKMAKFMGEKGALTQQDVTRYIESPALRDSLLSHGSRAFSGKISNKDYKQISGLVNLIQERLKARVNDVYENSARSYSRNTGIPLERSRFLINPTIEEQGQQASTQATNQPQASVSDMVKVKLPDGRQGSIPKANLSEALKRGATEIK